MNKKPDYSLVGIFTPTMFKAKLGNGFKAHDGSITIHLFHPFISIRNETNWNFVLVPVERRYDKKD